MTPTIEMKPLSQTKRRIVFLLSLTLFILAVPFSVFYAIGYRFDFTDELNNIKSVGGMYVRNETEGTEMFINDEPVEDMRVFQKAAYIQNLEAGMHRLHVQGNGVQTWVKNLPVYAHFVTEVTSFNLPKTPQIRIIAEWSDPQDGRGVLFDTATSTFFTFASTTVPLHFSETMSTSSLVANPEFVYVSTLIASSTEERALLDGEEDKEEPFGFGKISTSTKTRFVNATTTKTWRDFTLFEKGEDVYISFLGSQEDIPYYYCVLYGGQKKTTSEYGAHVYKSLYEQLASTTNMAHAVGERLCRHSIRIDRLGQEVQWFDFYADSSDIILMHLQDGLYAVEVDDRAWQNTQLIYPGEDLEIVHDGGKIYVKDGEYYLEVFTEIAPQ
jgi:hypothetical protein